MDLTTVLGILLGVFAAGYLAIIIYLLTRTDRRLDAFGERLDTFGDRLDGLTREIAGVRADIARLEHERR